MTRHHITTDDGREIDEREVADMVPARGHGVEACVEGCWCCLVFGPPNGEAT